MQRSLVKNGELPFGNLTYYAAKSIANEGKTEGYAHVMQDHLALRVYKIHSQKSIAPP